jgi:hypothetical protein
MGKPLPMLTCEFTINAHGDVRGSNATAGLFSVSSSQAASVVYSVGAVVVFSHDGHWWLLPPMISRLPLSPEAVTSEPSQYQRQSRQVPDVRLATSNHPLLQTSKK